VILKPLDTVAGFAVEVSEIPLLGSLRERSEAAYRAVVAQFPEYRIRRYELADASEGIFWLERK